MITFAGGHQVLTFTDRGIGLIVCPVPAPSRAQAGRTDGHAHDHGHSDDGASGREPEWDSVVRRLRFFGWEVVHDGGAGLRLVGVTRDGRLAYGLSHQEAPPLDDAAAALALRELCRAADVVPLN